MNGQKVPISTARFVGESTSLELQNFLKFFLSLVFTLLKQFICLALKVTKFEV